jgi:hypothetical protein
MNYQSVCPFISSDGYAIVFKPLSISMKCTCHLEIAYSVHHDGFINSKIDNHIFPIWESMAGHAPRTTHSKRAFLVSVCVH